MRQRRPLRITSSPVLQRGQTRFHFQAQLHRGAAHYTRKLEEFVSRCSRVMTIDDVADLAGLGWDAAKRIVKRRLRRDYGGIDLRGVRHLSIDEIYVGRRRGFYTLEGRFTMVLAAFAPEPGTD